MRAFQDILNIDCEKISPNYGDGITVNTVKKGNSCLIKSTGTYAGTTVSKVVVINQNINSKYAAAVMCNLTNLNIEGSGSIESCDSACKTPALINGVKDNENLNKKIKDIANATCKKNNKGLVAEMNPYLTDDNFSCDKELLSIYFNGVS
ncbi:MAG: hypothetical protein ACP5O4_08390, partial [bacterium]